MESVNSASRDPQTTVEPAPPRNQEVKDQWFSERFDSLLPKIQEHWPDLAKQTLEATKGSLDEVVRVIANHSGNTPSGVYEQLDELVNTASNRTRDFAESLEPLEKQLEELLDDLNKTLRPRIEKPIRERPLLAIGFATAIGLLLGIVMSGNRKSS